MKDERKEKAAIEEKFFPFILYFTEALFTVGNNIGFTQIYHQHHTIQSQNNAQGLNTFKSGMMKGISYFIFCSPQSTDINLYVADKVEDSFYGKVT